MCGVKKEQEGDWSQTAPVMLMMLALGGCWGLKMHYKSQRNAQNMCSGQCLWMYIPMLVAPSLHDEHTKGFACLAQTKPDKLCMLHGCLMCLAQISSTFLGPNL